MIAMAPELVGRAYGHVRSGLQIMTRASARVFFDGMLCHVVYKLCHSLGCIQRKDAKRHP